MGICSFQIAEVHAALADLHIGTGATIVVHSSLMHLGRPNGIPSAEYPERLTDVMLDCVGPNGTVAVPASNWDYGQKGTPFNLQASPVAKDLGVLGNHFLTRPGVVRSPNPTFSLAIVGEKSKWICAGGNAHAFGYDSAWDRLFRVNADMIFMGCGLASMSFVRYMEMRFGVPYLYNKYFSAPVFDHGKPIKQPIVSLLRYRSIPVTYGLQRFEGALRAAGVLREVALGGSAAIAIRMDECFAIGMECLKRDIHFFLAAIPEYLPNELPVI